MALQDQLRAAVAERRAAEAELRETEELANWKIIHDRNGIRDLRDHLVRFPNGITKRYALEKLEQLVWAALGSTPNITQLRAYDLSGLPPIEPILLRTAEGSSMR